MTTVNNVSYTKLGNEYAKNDHKYAKKGAKIGAGYVGISSLAAGAFIAHQEGAFGAAKGLAKKGMDVLKTKGIKDFATKAFAKIKNIKVSPDTLKIAGKLGAAIAAGALIYAGVGALFGHIADKLVEKGAKKEADRRGEIEA